MSLGAIVTLGNPSKRAEGTADCLAGAESRLLDRPLACVEVVGSSILERLLDRFERAGVETVSVLIESGATSCLPFLPLASRKLNVQIVEEIDDGIVQTICGYRRHGIEHSFVNSADSYAETDLLDFFYFHQEARQPVTRAISHKGPLDSWIIDCSRTREKDFDTSISGQGHPAAAYFVREYVHHFTHPRSLRRFAADVLSGQCERGPSGQEIRPGVWIDGGAEVHRTARLVAPVYVGRGTRILGDTLITRLSSIERGCVVDCGTAVEDSCILAHTHVGIWLDVRHSVVSGNTILNLERAAAVQISDPKVLGTTLSTHYTGAHCVTREVVKEITEEFQPPRMPKDWQLSWAPVAFRSKWYV